MPYIEGWYVDDDLRRAGVGGQLIGAAEKWALVEGHNEIASDTAIDNHRSAAAHKRLGYVEVDRAICFRKELSEEGN